VAELLHKDPARRPNSASQVRVRLVEISKALDSDPTSTHVASKAPCGRRRTHRRVERRLARTATLTVALVAAVAVVAIGLLMPAANRATVDETALRPERAAPDGESDRSEPIAPADPTEDGSSGAPGQSTGRARSVSTSDGPIRQGSGIAPTTALAASSPDLPSNATTPPPDSTAPGTTVATAPPTSPSVPAPPIAGVIPVPTSIDSGPCAEPGAVLCESLDLGLAAWQDRTDPLVASVAVVDDATRASPVLQWAPTELPSQGGSWVQQSFDLSSRNTMSVRTMLRIDARASGGDWFVNVLAVTDESDRRWNLDATPAAGGGVTLGVYFTDANGVGHYGAPTDTLTTGVWHCVELTVDTNSATGARLLVDGRELASIDQRLPDAVGLAHSLQLGSGWTSSAAIAPTVTYDDVAVADTPLGC
jgi:hypothetical protein